jgi:hypothetical protein
MIKLRLFLLLLISGLFSFRSDHQKKWGFVGHQRINRMAIFTLPQELVGFYKEHIEYISEHSVDPDKRRYTMEGEAKCHYIDIDHYGKNGGNPFEVVPRSWNLAVQKFSEDTLNAYGIVPWHIHLMKLKLQKAFETKDAELILKYSAEIGHYVADAHVPLHTTENYNGQLTNQKGIHGLWESRLVELNVENYTYFVGKANYIEKVTDFAWDAVQTSHLALDSVFSLERKISSEFSTDKKYSFEAKGNITTRVYSYEFAQAYHKSLNGMVERRMKKAILATGSVWYTAWIDAGQPDLSQLRYDQPTTNQLEEQKKLDDAYLIKSAVKHDCGRD